MPRIRPRGQCEECPADEGLKEIVSHGLCAKHNQQRLRAIWRKPEPSDTQKQKLMEKLEKDLIAIKNMCSKWERDGYVAMKLITPETIETFRAELDDYMDFRPTLKSAPPKTEMDEALESYKPPPPMFDDEDEDTASKKAAPGQYQFSPVVEKPATPTTAAIAPTQAKEPKAVEKSGPTPKVCAEAGWTFKKKGDPKNILEIAEVDYDKRELEVIGSDTPVSFDDVLFLTDPEHPDRDLTNYFAAYAKKNGLSVNSDQVTGIAEKPPQSASAREPKSQLKAGSE